MDTGWVEAVMLMNARIVEAEDSFTTRVTDLVAMAEQGQDTSNIEVLLASDQRKLFLLRRIQAQLLQDPTAEV